MSPLSADPRCVYTSIATLRRVLWGRYAAWYREGLSDKEISEAIATVQRQRGSR